MFCLCPAGLLKICWQSAPRRFLVKHRRAIAVSTIYIVFVAVIVLSLVAIIPAVVSNLMDFYNNLPSLIGDFVNWFNSLNLGVTIGDGTIQQIFDNEFFSFQKMLSYLNFDNVNKYAQGVINAGSGLFKGVYGNNYISLYIN